MRGMALAAGMVDKKPANSGPERAVSDAQSKSAGSDGLPADWMNAPDRNEPKSGRLDQAALDFATWVAMASINGGFRQS